MKASKGAYILSDVFNPADLAGMKKQKDQTTFVIAAILLLIFLILAVAHGLTVHTPTL